MTTPSTRQTPSPLAQVRLVLSPGAARRGWLVWCALLIAALLGGAAGGRWLDTGPVGPGPEATAALQQLRSLQLALDKTRLEVRASDARSHELERLIDALNQRLRECQEELTFFRKTHDGKP